MIPDQTDLPHGPVIDADPGATYSLEVIARICGVTSRTILHYHEHGLIQMTAGAAAGGRFNDDAVHRLRRIEHLRSAYGMDIAAVKLTLTLLDEVERLRAELRAAAKAR